MKRTIIILIFTTMCLSANSQWARSSFFDRPAKTRYTVKLQAGDSALLSKQDTKVLIDILAKYEWEENRGAKVANTEARRISWGRYHFYNSIYYIHITHPNTRSVRLGIHTGGLNRDDFFIFYPNEKYYGTIRMKNNQMHNLRSEDVEKIKQLFFENITSFGNAATVEDEKLTLSSTYSFGLIFHNLKVPNIELSEEDSNLLVKLYNRGWNNSAQSFHGGKPLPEIKLYQNHSNFLPRSARYIHSLSSPLEFTAEDKQAIDQLLDKVTKGRNGVMTTELKMMYGYGEAIHKVYFEYDSGLLHGDVKVYDKEGKLTHKLVYDKGLPITYIKYYDGGQMEVEAHLSIKNLMVEWKEYDEEGNVTDSDRNGFQNCFNWERDIAVFYKYNRTWRESSTELHTLPNSTD